MDYIFGTIHKRGKDIHILKTVGSEHTDLKGAHSIERKFPDSIITDNFVVDDHYLAKTDAEGVCYDWYILSEHSRYIDYFTPLKEQIETDITDSQNALCDLSADLEEMLVDIENALCELTEE